MRSCCKLQEQFGIRRGLKNTTALYEFCFKFSCIGEVTIMRDGNAAAFEVSIERLNISQDSLALCRISGMADSGVSI